MDVVVCETEEVHEEKHKREVKIDLVLPLEVEPEAEKDGDRHPAEIEDTGEEVHHLARVDCEEFVGGEGTGGSGYAEEVFLVFVEPLDVDGINLVVGEDVHPVVGYSEECEWEERDDEAARGGRDEEQQRESYRDIDVLRSESYEDAGDKQPYEHSRDYYH